MTKESDIVTDKEFKDLMTLVKPILRITLEIGIRNRLIREMEYKKAWADPEIRRAIIQKRIVLLD